MIKEEDPSATLVTGRGGQGSTNWNGKNRRSKDCITHLITPAQSSGCR